MIFKLKKLSVKVTRICYEPFTFLLFTENTEI